MGRSAVPISWARGRTLRGFRDPVKPERSFSRWPRPHWPERPPEGSHCASVAASGCGPHAPGSPLHAAPADRFAPLFAGCTRSSSSRRALEPARRTPPPAPIEAPPSLVGPCVSPFSSSDAEGTSCSTPPPVPVSPAPPDSAWSCERARRHGPSTVGVAPSTGGAAVTHLPVGACADRAPLPLLVGPSDQLLRPEARRTGHQLSPHRSSRRSPCPHGLRPMTAPHRSGS